tara:strand:+ start:19706 stop:20578 length:873 start_codon:yes stop_codon:yes gene_type:complete
MVKTKLRKKGGRNNTKKFKKMNCSPGKKRLNYSCYDYGQLNKIKHAWNKRHPDREILTSDDREIWHALKNNMSYSCNNEKCWLKHLLQKYEIDDDLLTYTFSPMKPKEWHDNPKEWLSSDEIEAVMAQYEKTFPEFAFIGSSPINFNTIVNNNCVWPELCKFDIQSYLNKNINKIGISFNLDPHDKPGSHWVTLFVDIKKKLIIYFDSNGIEPPETVAELIEKIISQCSNKNIKLEKIINKLSHQRENTECGMYSLFFCDQMIRGANYKNFTEKRIDDSKMLALRNKYFN